MKKVLVTEPIHPDGMAILNNHPDFEVKELSQWDEASLLKAVPDVDAILVRSAQINETVLAEAGNVQVVSRHGVGCDNIAVPVLSRRKIPMAIAASANSTSVAEHVIMMIMMLTKQAVAYDQAAREGRYHDRGKFHTTELADKTILIIGYGRIGRKLAPICKAFGMRVIVADIALDHALAEQQQCETTEDFRPFLSEADFVSVHVPLNDETADLIDSAELAQMPSHAIVINCARGGIVNESAVARAVLEGGIAGTGADVFSVEPPPMDNPLLSLPNSVLSPHSAAVTREGARRMGIEAAQNIVDHFNGSLRASHVFNAAELGLL
ncbi:MAG: hydroxyacid dehydrogenase [Burkholderiaceae bacterium]